MRHKKYEYKTLSQEEMDEIVVDFLKAQERDLFCHEINLARYEEMLKVLPPGPWRDRITQLRDETIQRKAEVESIIAATQVPNKQRIEAALKRIKAKEEGLSGA